MTIETRDPPTIERQRVLGAISRLRATPFWTIEKRSGVQRHLGLKDRLMELVSGGDIVAEPIQESGWKIPAFRRIDAFAGTSVARSLPGTADLPIGRQVPA